MAESSLIMKFLIESGYYDDKTILNRCIEIKRILYRLHKYSQRE